MGSILLLFTSLIMNIAETRKQIILNIIELHNHFCKEWHKRNPTMPLNLWNKDEFEMQPDRYYIVESLTTTNSDYDNKTFAPRLEVRKHLRSKERKAYGDGHDAFYKGYLSTIGHSIEDIENVEKTKAYITEELSKPRN